MIANDKYLKSLSTGGKFYSLEKVAQQAKVNIETLPFTIRILLENVLRNSPADSVTSKAALLLDYSNNIGHDLAFYPARILLQDYTGVPCVVDIASMRDAARAMKLDADTINPKIPVDLVIDHSVQVDEAGNVAAMAYNVRKEFLRNSERYKLLKWAQKSFQQFRAIPPDTGIIHQINIEYLSPVIQKNEALNIYYPDTVFGTDSHTTMINGLGVLGWGVGGLEAEACMLGEASIFDVPQVIGVKFLNQLSPGSLATDLALKVTQALRENNVVGKFVEYFGPGYEKLSLADRATIANMSPEYGSTCGYFPFNEASEHYLSLTGRSKTQIDKIVSYMKENHLYYQPKSANQINYSKVIEIDLASVKSSVAGPKRPQDLVLLPNVPQAFKKAVSAPSGNHGFGQKESDADREFPFILNNKPETLKTGDVLIAAITSCTNTSNPFVLIGAGLLARNAVQHGLVVGPKVKTSFAPGSQAVTGYLQEAGLSTYLDKLGFNIIAYGCTTCIGNSGPLAPEIEAAVKASDIIGAAVLSGNRNFEGRINPMTKANYLASPLLVIAYAIAGNLQINIQQAPLGTDPEGHPVYLKDIWPSSEEINQYVKQYVTSKTYQRAYKNIFSGTKEWNDLPVTQSDTYPWDDSSTYLANPPYFDNQIRGQIKMAKLKDMRVLAKLGDSVTTDHISPAGTIGLETPAGEYLMAHGVEPKDFNSYGSRRGNDRVMVRGTLANPRLHNALANGKEGGYTTFWPTKTIETIYQASQDYQENGIELLILAGKDYGMGSSRDWAAKGVKLLGVKAIIAESYERIHRSNLVMMGLLPLQYTAGQTADSLGLTGSEKFTLHLPSVLKPRQKITVDALTSGGQVITFDTLTRFDSEIEVSYYKVGGILNKILADKIVDNG